MKSSPGDVRDRARRTALELLTRREHTRSELARKLGRRGYEPDLVAWLLDELTTSGLLSEARFAEAFVAARVRRGQGPLRIRAELNRRGLGAGAIALALRESGVDWLELARTVRNRRFGAAAPSDIRARARQVRFLEYRGFGADEVYAVVPPCASAESD